MNILTKGEKRCTRGKRLCNHANPLFEKWLQEWKEDAELHKSNNKYNLHRAILSLRKFPLPVYSGDDCKILSNFGDKICKMIDKRLGQYEAENGPINWSDHIKVNDVKKGKPGPKKKKSFTMTPSSSGSTVSSEHVKNAPKKRKGREYIPSYRSGAYALLIALNEATTTEGSPSYLKKQELIDAAQPLSDASFTIPPMGSHYTAFSSMSLLIKKGLATKEGNPARYSLTKEGAELALRLKDDGASSQLSSSSKCSNNNNNNNKKSTKLNEIHRLSTSEESDGSDEVCVVEENSMEDDEGLFSSALLTPAVSVHSQEFQGAEFNRMSATEFKFTYVDSFGRDTNCKEKANVNFDAENSFFGFLIKCRRADIPTVFNYQIDTTRAAPPSMTYAYISDDCAPEFSPADVSRIGASPQTDPGETAFAAASNTTKDFAAIIPCRPSCSAQPKASLYEFKPHSFKVVLCVDNQEVLGGFSSSKSHSKKEIIITELTKNGVDFNVRKLHVGDFLWVCQELSPIGKPREMVLPLIIERKRMDDLASSIKDGRFKEQKFRLKQSGLQFPIYLVEHYGSNYLNLPLSNCEQAVVNTQIIDDFHVKWTLDQRESAAYLTIMTRYLQALFKKKTLHCIQHCTQQPNTEQDLDSSHYNLVGFEEFNTSSMKNRQLSVSEMFLKHLIQLFGLSVDKASAILEKYPTPRCLIEALKKCHSDRERESLLALLKCSNSGRSLGPALSAQVARLYSRESLS